MARTVNDIRLMKREQRLKLPVQKKPYWTTLNEGEHLGYYRGARVGKWQARFRAAGSGVGYLQTTLGEADDFADADGVVILDFRQAQQAARAWILNLERNEGRKIGKYTVSDALDDYMKGFQGKDRKNTQRRIDTIIKPQLGQYEVAKLTHSIIGDWLIALAESPARLRTAKGTDQNYRKTPDTDEGRRRRRSTSNRTMTILKAALNTAYRNGRAAADDAWRRVRPFPNTEAAKLRYLSDEEARRLTNACASDFRPMVQAALLTGARYSELGRLTVGDFDQQARVVWLIETKSGKPRAAYLNDEGCRLFAHATAGKRPSALLFPRPDDEAWGESHQNRRMAAACKAGNVERATFHDLRRTYGARLAIKGTPLSVIAQAMGHADERITRRHYAHLCPSYVADTVRRGVGGLEIVPESNVESLRLTEQQPDTIRDTANVG